MIAATHSLGTCFLLVRSAYFQPRGLLKKADKPIASGGRALDILIALVERAGEVVTNKELISAVWPDVVVEKSNLRFQMATLRKALGDG
jgi:DNA-binding winged helix-turn-helix (wHTH) protein